MSEWAPLVAALVAGITAWLVANVAISRSPTSLIRTNVSGVEVPAVLGWGVLAGGLAAGAVFAFFIALSYADDGCKGVALCTSLLILPPWELVWTPLIPLVGMFAAGTWDDMKGDERPRGFGGHLNAARGGILTGGVVKLVAGAVVALATVAALNEWRIPPIGDWLLFAAPIALAANLINLLDRAPGRALKVFLLLALPMMIFVPSWRLLGAGSVGAAFALLAPDVRARGMLGDAGANPLGAVLGLGLVLAAGTIGTEPNPTRAIVAILILVLLGLNLASEKWSFSKVIESTPWLARLDHLGRK